MTRVTVDKELLEKLQGLEDVLEFCDESGRTLGVFQPVVNPPGLQSPISPEELERRRQQRTGRPLSDILRDLRESYGA